MPGIQFSEVAAKLSAERFARREMQMRGGRARCPWCSDGSARHNLAFYARDGKCHCFRCGETSDVVGLAAQVWHVTQLDAARLLNEEFSLCIADSTPTDEQRQRRQNERKRREAAERAEREAWSAAADELREAEQAAAGLRIEDADNPATWAAVARMGAALDRWHAMRAG